MNLRFHFVSCWWHQRGLGNFLPNALLMLLVIFCKLPSAESGLSAQSPESNWDVDFIVLLFPNIHIVTASIVPIQCNGYGERSHVLVDHFVNCRQDFWLSSFLLTVPKFKCRRPQHSTQPVAKVGADNHGEIELTVHHKIIAAAQQSHNATYALPWRHLSCWPNHMDIIQLVC